MIEIFLGTAAVFSLLLVILGFRSFYQVEEGHSAVITNLGKLRADKLGEPFIAEPGLHIKLPWEKLHEFSIMERTISLREEMREVEFLARDGTQLRLTPQIRFQFQKERFPTYLFGMKRPASHLRELFRSLLSAEVAKFGPVDAPEGSYAEIRRNHGLLHAGLKQSFLARGLEEKYGIQFSAVEITEILPPADLAQALNSVQKTETENITLLSRFRAECSQRLAAAEHAVSIAALKAEAVESEISILGDAMRELQKQGTLDAYLQRRRHEVTAQSKTLYFKT
ncbi:SPFH domain-containing protein [Glaciimonas sp. GNP009]|uniref:SPFH domain-containing protein n=2 Tax=Glaciimonas sp. CA11.2 TaxID=3048601 RepID=UPI002AB40831|nr:SPFH domain-containing protein [Glaciimonas sp. CA11.2]MDY7548979.1 SPFH domain-containing protein [Glaciimonas sp. CA11.2]